ncbi:unnamed protein product [Symbiodinium necroappetens]|uniref:Uncharacterized protein n=1 Tax=Symbiodinium necroappetens TaxID=1628268 RepID=A0A812Y4B2_9DINO|nr:unnamed protein product [Symbiodinium necroappetens]
MGCPQRGPPHYLEGGVALQIPRYVWVKDECPPEEEAPTALVEAAVSVATSDQAFFSSELRGKVLASLEARANRCGLTRLLAQLVVLIGHARNTSADASGPDSAGGDVALRAWIGLHVQPPLPSFWAVAGSIVPEVLEVAGAAIEHRLRHLGLPVEPYGSCDSIPDVAAYAFAVNAEEKAAGKTFWSKARELASSIVRKGAFEWVNAARVAFSSSLIQKAAREACPFGVMALKLIRCIGHDAEQKQEEVVTLDTDAEELMQWTSEPDIATLLHNAWPLWGLLAVLAGQRKHSFIITARDAPKAELFDQAPLLDAMWEKQQSGNYPLGAVWITAVPRRTDALELSTWLSRLRNALKVRNPPYTEHQVLLVLEQGSDIPKTSCKKMAWFGFYSGPLLHCVWSTWGASPGLDALALAYFILRRGTPVAFLNLATISFPGLGDKASHFLTTQSMARHLLFITDTQVLTGAGAQAERTELQAPFIDVGLRLFRPSHPTLSLIQDCFRIAYENPFMAAEDVVNRFEVSSKLDLLLTAGHGFVSSEGWKAEDVKTTAEPMKNRTPVDAHLAGGILLFSMRPFNVLPRWFTGKACLQVCQSGLLKCAPGAGGTACELLSGSMEEALLLTLKNSFAFSTPGARSARPRVLQAGPSSCGTTSIAHFYSDGHGLRVAKNYIEGREIRDHVRLDMSLGRAPFAKLDRFDVVADAFDVVRVGIHFCSDVIGRGGETCEKIHYDALQESIDEYKGILRALQEAYPNLWFIHNTCKKDRWLPKRVHNCWPHVVAMPGDDWPQWLRQWKMCCDESFGIGGNQSCWVPEEQALIKIPKRLNFRDFVYAACCDGLTFYKTAWDMVHTTLEEIIVDERRVPFNILRQDPRELSEVLGLQDDFKASAWRQIHKNILEYRTAKLEARMNTVGFESGGMPKRMIGTKPNNMDDYRSRFETMGLASGGSAAMSKSMQGNAQAAAQKAQALGEAMGAGGARVPLVPDAGRTMEMMLEKFVSSRLDKYAVAAAERQNKEFKKEEKKGKKKDKKKKDKKKKDKKRKKDKKKEIFILIILGVLVELKLQWQGCRGTR